MIMDKQKIKILVVDDDAFFRKILPLKLKSEGYQVEIAEQGNKALEMCHADPSIRLVISDINMPEMNGIELIEALRKNGSDVPIIVLTSNSKLSVALKAMNSGANDYILKDENIMKAISISVRKTLEKYQLMEKNRRLMKDLAQKNEALERSNQELLKLNRLKNRFLGIAAHDLRNPLISIRGLSELLVAETFGSLTSDQKQYIEIIHTTSDEMLALVNDLLDVSVIESGKLDLRLEKGSLGHLLENRCKISSIIARRKDITLHTDFAQIPEVMFDPNRIAQAFDNFTSNAIKYSPPGSNVYIRMTQEDGKVRVCVRDEGPGISEKDQRRMFGAFERLSAQPTGGEKSTGLGLAIVKKIIEAHQGSLEVESQVGSGSSFSFKIPVYEEVLGV